MKKIIFSSLIILSLVQTPLALVHAQNSQTNASTCDDSIDNISDVLNLAGCIIKRALIPLLVLLSTVVFIIGVIKYIAGADQEAKRDEGRQFMIYGIVALFVMVSIWGLVGIIQGTFGLGTQVLIPQLQGI